MKVRFGAGDHETRDRMIAELCARRHATLVQRVGNVALLFLRKKKDSRFATL
jgi:RNA-binding protein YhbY